MPKQPPSVRRVLLTGATRGCGFALVRFFVSAGHEVAGCGRSREQVGLLGREFGPPHQFAAVDVADDRAVAEWAETLSRKGWAPDLLVNNAAVIARNAPLWELAPEEFDPVIDVNVKGVANVIRHFVPRMIARGRGVIVNFSSGWGRSTSPEVAAYCASKWAIEGLTQALAQELPQGLSAVALNPGIIDTEMLRTCFGPAAGHYPKPEDWVRQAGPFLLGLGPKHNGAQLTVPSIPID